MYRHSHGSIFLHRDGFLDLGTALLTAFVLVKHVRIRFVSAMGKFILAAVDTKIQQGRRVTAKTGAAVDIEKPG